MRSRRDAGALTTGAVLPLVPGLTLRMINYWRSRGAVTPSIANAEGSGSRCLWSERDVERLRALVGMRDTLDFLVHPAGWRIEGMRQIWDALAEQDSVTVGPITVSL